MKRTIIPYNEHLKLLARKLRQRMTFSEVKLWKELKHGKMMGYDFDRQRVVGNYIVDFYCKELQLAIEVDGITHEGELAAAKDKRRQEELEGMGVQFIRVEAMLVVNKVEAAVKEIARWIEAWEAVNGVPERAKRKRKE